MTLEPLFREYEAFHKDGRNKLCHYFGITMIVFSVVAFAALVPVGLETHGVRLDLTVPLVALAAAFYLTLDVSLGIGSLVILAGFAVLAERTPWPVSVALFLVGWVLQFVGHAFEGKRPAFLTNALHTLVGPIWILSHLYEKVGLRRRTAPAG